MLSPFYYFFIALQSKSVNNSTSAQQSVCYGKRLDMKIRYFGVYDLKKKHVVIGQHIAFFELADMLASLIEKLIEITLCLLQKMQCSFQ